jgi:hypothetical protein
VALSLKPNKFGLDPFLMCDTAKADYYYGRTDVGAEGPVGEANALISEARKKDPDLDKSLPWMLLARGMYSFLYKKQEVEFNRRLGRKDPRPGDPLPQVIRITPIDWAEAFNIITFSYVQNGFFRRPSTIKVLTTASGRKVALAILVQDPGKGREKSESYLRPDERQRTIKILRRMERHRLDLGELPAVQKHLSSLRDPEIQS